jgi:hypothetical protein
MVAITGEEIIELRSFLTAGSGGFLSEAETYVGHSLFKRLLTKGIR